MIKHDLKMILFSVDCNLDLEFENLEWRGESIKKNSTESIKENSTESIKKNSTERKGQQVTPIQVVRYKKEWVSQEGREGGARLVSINRQVKQGVSLEQSPATSIPLFSYPSINNDDHEPFGDWNIFVSDESKDG